jgi:hypothetical protein
MLFRGNGRLRENTVADGLPNAEVGLDMPAQGVRMMSRLNVVLRTQTLRKAAVTVTLSTLLILSMVGIAGARIMTQPVVSVATTPDGVAENGLSFWVYDGGPFTIIELDGVRAVRLDERSGSSSRYLYLNLHDDVVLDGPFDAEITFTYRVPQTGRFRLLYDSEVSRKPCSPGPERVRPARLSRFPST